MSKTATTDRSGPVQGKWPGVAAIDYNGDRYCIDCAKVVLDGESFSYEANDKWESVEDADGEDIIEQLVAGDIYTLSSGGVVLKHSVDHMQTWHCGRHKDCEHALDGDEHNYDHDCTVGVRLKV